MNPVLIITHNLLEITKRCVASVREQDIKTTIFIVDNGSTDGTTLWAVQNEIVIESFPGNSGFSVGMNCGLRFIFEELGADYCLCPNNDTVLPRWYYRMLVETGFPIVSGVQGSNGEKHTIEDLSIPPAVDSVRPSPDFCAFLIRRNAWEAIGPFDETMVNYASDCDYHLRGHKLGIEMNHVDIPFYHEGSATIRLGDYFEGLEISARADKDREVFRKKWGFYPGSDDYKKQFDTKDL